MRGGAQEGLIALFRVNMFSSGLISRDRLITQEMRNNFRTFPFYRGTHDGAPYQQWIGNVARSSAVSVAYARFSGRLPTNAGCLLRRRPPNISKEHGGSRPCSSMMRYKGPDFFFSATLVSSSIKKKEQIFSRRKHALKIF